MHTDQSLHTDAAYEMPSAEAMLAGTLALMTGHAQSACARQRCLMSQKIVANLLALSQHPALSPPFKTVAERMRPHWKVLAQAMEAPLNRPMPTVADPQPLWHTAATRVQ